MPMRFVLSALLIPFLLAFAPCQGADRVFPPTAGISIIQATTSTAYHIEPVDNPADSSEISEVFIPLIASTPSNTGLYNTKGANFVARMWNPAATGTPPPTRSGVNIPINIEIDDTSKTWDLFIAAKRSSDDNYQVVHNESSVSAGSHTINFDLNSICNVHSNLNLDCTNFHAALPDQENIVIFISIGEQGTVDAGASPDNINPNNFTGIYLRLLFSSQINTVAPTLSKVYKGDGRLLAVYDGPAIDQPLSNFAYVIPRGTGFTDNTCTQVETAAPFANASGGTGEDMRTIKQNGYGWVKNLTNDICYTVQAYFEDKYHFASTLSSGMSAIPEDIETLLKKQACYLLSAGFGGDHPTIEYFRALRDSILKKYSLGRRFIDLYYAGAPTVVPIILKSPTLATIIRGTAISVQWILQNVWLSMFLLIGIFTAILGVKRGRSQ